MVGSHGNPIELIFSGKAGIPSNKRRAQTAIDQFDTDLQKGMCTDR